MAESALTEEARRRREEGKAISQIRDVSLRMINQVQENTWKEYVRFMKRGDLTSFRDFQREIRKSYFMLKSHIEEMSWSSDTDYSPLFQIDKKVGFDRLNQDNIKRYKKYHDLLNKALHELGVTDIKLKASGGGKICPAFQGLGFDTPKWAEWNYLKYTIKELRRKLREDIDGFIAIIGGNRVGKSSLGLQLADIANKGDLTPKNLVFDDKDFWTAANELPQYSSFLIDEISRVFYSKDAMKGDQKSRKKLMKTYAKKNMLVFGCDLNFYNIDKELREDKIIGVIHIPGRGRFEYYSKRKMSKFSKDKDDGSVIWPQPNFKGRFPECKKNKPELWKLYQEEEDRKIEKNGEEDGEKERTMGEVIEEIKKDMDRYTKNWGKKKIIDHHLIEADFDDVGGRKAKKIKSKIEADIL